VVYLTVNDTATAPSDYTATSGSLTFAPGDQVETIAVSVIGDTVKESNETFVVQLDHPDNATIADPIGLSTIKNDELTPVNVSVSPNSSTSAAGTARTFVTKYSDANGAANISLAYLLINNPFSGSNALWGYYNVTGNKLYLRNNTNDGWVGGFAPGSASVISTNRGSLDCAATTVTKSGNVLTINWSFTPNTGFAGTRKLFLLVQDKTGLKDGWDELGIWTITAPVPREATAKEPS
jgi:hypothetical protein